MVRHGSLINTFADCRYRKCRDAARDFTNNDECNYDRLQLLDERTCDEIVADGDCPEGFQS